MQKVKIFLKRNWHLLSLLTFSLISHWYIFFDSNILNAGDWVYTPFYFLRQLLSYSLWNAHSGLGTVMAFGSNMVFYWLASFLANVSVVFSWDVFTRVFFLVPIVFLTPIFSFLLFKKITNNNLIAFFSACIYSFNTFFLKLHLDWITYAFIWWILPALFLNTLNYLESKNKKYLIYNVLLVFLGFIYELRIMILVLIFLSFFQIVYLVFNSSCLKIKFKNVLFVMVSFFTGILGHSFWLIPLRSANIFNEVISRVSPYPFNSFYDILDVFTLHMYSWSKNLVLSPFIKQPIEPRHFLIPLIGLIGLITFKKLFKSEKGKLFFAFFSLSLVIFMFLGKQEFEPFGGVYNWLFQNFPLFNLYRESSKFFILVALPLSFFFGLGLFFIYGLIKKVNLKLAFVSVALILFFSSIFNLQNFVNQEINGMTKGKIISNDYLHLEEILSSDPDYYRILWVPIRPRFGFYSDKHPFINLINLRNTFDGFDENLPIYYQLISLLQQDYSNHFLDSMSVKYVIVPSSEEVTKKISSKETLVSDKIYEPYGERSKFIEALNELSYLKKVDIGMDDLLVYENEDYNPHFHTIQNIIHTNLDRGSLINLKYYENFHDFGVYFDNSRALLDRANDFVIVSEPEINSIKKELEVGVKSKQLFFPYVRWSPGSLVYPLILQKEKYEKNKLENQPLKLFESYLLYSNKRIAEFIKYAQKDIDLSENVMKDYCEEMTGALRILEDLKMEGNINYEESLLIYKSVLSGHKMKMEKIDDSAGWKTVFKQIEERMQALKIDYDFHNMSYKFKIAKSGEYKVMISEDGNLEKLSEQYFESGDYSLNLPIEWISNNLVNDDLRVDNYLANSIYRINFDYQASSNIKLIITEDEEAELLKVNLLSTDENFKHFETYFKSSGEVTGLDIEFLDQRGNPPKIEYDNFEVQRILEPVLILTKYGDEKFDTQPITPKINFTKITPTKYKVRVGNVLEPYTLVFAESFHPGWKVYLDNQSNQVSKTNLFETWGEKSLPEERHSLIDGYANSWYIEPDDVGGQENYVLIIEFAPQKLFYVGLSISLLIVISCLIYLIINFFKNYGEKS